MSKTRAARRVLDNLPQGVVMFGGEERLLVSNRHYRDVHVSGQLPAVAGFRTLAVDASAGEYLDDGRIGT